MTITLFADTNFKGCSQSFASDKPDLKDTKVGNNPSSITLSKEHEAVLLFKRKDWQGSVLYIRGPKEVCDLGSKSEGGKSGFKNGITSLRRTPFVLDLNVSVVITSKGDFPADWTSLAQAEQNVGTIIKHVNRFYDIHDALLDLRLAIFTERISTPYFVINKGEANYPANWKRPGTIDVIFVDSFKKTGKSGLAKPPMFGETITIAARDFGNSRELQNMARSLAHELGHYLGIHHGSANKNSSNIMYTPGNTGESIFDRNLRPDQIEDMHTTLSKNLARKGDR